MINHYHLVLKVDAEQAQGWSEREVAEHVAVVVLRSWRSAWITLREWPMVVRWKSAGRLAGLLMTSLVSGCATLVPAPISYLPQDPPPGAIPYGKQVYVDDGRCPDSQVKKLVGGDAKRNIPRQVECVPRPQ